MFKELLDALGKVKSRPLLNVFSALAFSTFMEGGGPLKDPFSVTSLLLPFFLMIASVLVLSWVLCVNYLNSHLADHDHFSWGPYLGERYWRSACALTFGTCRVFPTLLT